MKRVYQVLFSLTVLVACLLATSLSAEAHVKKISTPVLTQEIHNIFSTDSSNYIHHEVIFNSIKINTNFPAQTLTIAT